MKLHELSPAEGSVRKRFRKGRGPGSGNGKTAGRGHKGQNSRAGGGVRIGFEGGQLPLYRRLPKRGFTNARFKKEYAIINLGTLERYFKDGEAVTLDILIDKGILKKELCGLKVLASGEFTKKLDVQAVIFSAAAKEKIESLGGKAEVI